MFGTSGIRGRFGEDVTADLALDVGRALVADGADRVVVGRDARESGRVLRDALIAGITESGGDAIDLGLASTPTVARSVGWQDADAGVVITASHNPPEDNGIKLWQPSGQAFDEAGRERIADRVRDEQFDLSGWDDTGDRSAWDDAVDRHVAAIADAIGEPADPPQVALDVGNGVGGLTAEALRALGCEVETLNAEPDGSFPARPSEPTADHCESLAAHVAATGADLGIAHDGDADRARAVDETGEFLSGDELLALFARWAIEEGDGDRVAVPVDTSQLVADAVAEVGGQIEYTRVGDVFVAERAAEPGVAFGGEPSGAWIWPDETLCPDGPLAACRLAARLGTDPLSALRDELPTYPIRRDSVRTDDKGALMAAIEAALLEDATLLPGEDHEVTTVDGVRVDLADGWVLLRASGTQPLVRITAEAGSDDRADELFEAAREFVESRA